MEAPQRSFARPTAVAPKAHKAGKVVLIGLGVLGAGALAYFGINWLINKNAESSADDENKRMRDIKDEIKTNPTYTPPPVNNGFPLSANQHNANVTAMQLALEKINGEKISGAPTDYLGKNTLSALKLAGYNAPVSQADYNNILSLKKKTATVTPSGGGTNFANLKSNIGTSGVSYSANGLQAVVLGKNTKFAFAFYTNGRVFVQKQGVAGAVAKGTYSDGGASILLDGDYLAYNRGDVRKNMNAIVEKIEG